LLVLKCLDPQARPLLDVDEFCKKLRIYNNLNVHELDVVTGNKSAKSV